MHLSLMFTLRLLIYASGRSRAGGVGQWHSSALAHVFSGLA